MIDKEWATLLTVLAGFLLQAWRESRNRRWDREDRAALAVNVATSARHVAKTVAEGNAHLTEKIDANTEISTKAFKEANTVNLKLEKLGLQHNALQQQQIDQKQGDAPKES